MYAYIDKPSLTNRPDKPVKARKVPLSTKKDNNNNLLTKD